jgi:hypothetical protein
VLGGDIHGQIEFGVREVPSSTDECEVRKFVDAR